MEGDGRHPRDGDGEHRHERAPGALSDVRRALRAGGLVILPTETVYGLAADAAEPARRGRGSTRPRAGRASTP